MRILFVSDLHFQRHWYEWIDRQSDHEVCVIAGDLLHALEPFHTDLRSQAAWVSGWLRGHRSALVVCAGNHDVFDDGRWLQQARTPNVSVDGDLRKLDDVTFASVGWRRDNWPTGADIIVVHEPRWDRQWHSVKWEIWVPRMLPTQSMYSGRNYCYAATLITRQRGVLV